MRLRINLIADRLCRLLAAAGLTTLIVFAALTLINGLSRSLFDNPFDFVGDTASLIVAVAVASCVPMALWQKANISIDLVQFMLSARSAQVMRIVSSSIVLVAMVAVARQMFIYAGNAVEAGDNTAMLEIPTGPFWFYVAVMMAIGVAIQLLVVVGEAVRLAQGQVSPVQAILH